MKLKYMIPALCICTSIALPDNVHAQEKNKRRIVQNGSSMLWTTDCKNDIFHKEEK